VSSNLQLAQANQALQMAVTLGSADSGVQQFGGANSEAMTRMSLATMNQSSSQRLGAFTELLNQEGMKGGDAQALLRRFNKASTSEKYAMLQSAQVAGGVLKEGQISTTIRGEAPDLEFAGSFFSEGDAKNAMGHRLLDGIAEKPVQRTKEQEDIRNFFGDVSDERKREFKKQGALGTSANIVTAGVMGISNTLAWGWNSATGMKVGGEAAGIQSWDDAMKYSQRQGDAAGRFVSGAGEVVSGERARYAGAADAFKENHDLLYRALGGGPDASAARKQMMDKLTGIRGKYDRNKSFSEFGEADQGALAVLGAASTVSNHQALFEAAARGENVNLNPALDEYIDASGQGEQGYQDPALAQAHRQIMRGLAQGHLMGAHAHQKDALREQAVADVGEALQQEAARVGEDRSQLYESGIASFVGGSYKLGAAGVEARKKLTGAALDAFDLGLMITAYDPSNASRSDIEDYLNKMNEGKGPADKKMTIEDYDNASEAEKNNVKMAAGLSVQSEKTGKNEQNIAKMSIEQKRSIVQASPSSPMGRQAAYEIGVEQNYTALSKGKGGEYGAVAKILGLSMTDDQLTAMTGKQGDVAGNIGELLTAGGVEDKNIKAKITEAIKSGGDSVGGRAGALNALVHTDKDVAKFVQDKKAAADDPTFRVQKEMLGEMKTQTGILKAIADKAGAEVPSPEAPGKGKKTHPVNTGNG
jgi:hypothetical protein